MKRIIVISLLFMLSATAFAQKVSQKYIHDKNKPVLLVFTADWCGPCQAMKQNVFVIDSVAAALGGYNILMVDVDTPVGATYQERFARKEVQIPYFVVLDRSGAVKARKLGAMQAGEFLQFLRGSGTMKEGGSSLGAIKYINVPDHEDFVRGWEFEAGAGAALVTTSEDKGFKPGAEIFAGARYRKSHLVAFRMGFEAMYATGTVDFIPRITLAVPVDIELYLLDPAYLSIGAFGAVHSTKKVKIAPDAGVRVGLGYKFGAFDVSFHYNAGILNLNKGDIVNHVSASAMTLTVGYCF